MKALILHGLLGVSGGFLSRPMRDDLSPLPPTDLVSCFVPDGSGNSYGGIALPLHLNFYIYAGREVQICQSLDRLRGRVIQIDQTLVHAHLVLVTRILMHER